jgi:hypothetical protein
METILRYRAVRSNWNPKMLFFAAFKFIVTNNNNNNKLQVLSQTTFRYHHRLVHRRIRSALIRPSLFFYLDEGSLRSYEAPESIHQSTRCHNPEKSQKLPSTCVKTSNILGQSIFTWTSNIAFSLQTKTHSVELRHEAGQGLDNPGFEFRQKQQTSLFPHTTRLALGSNHSSALWVPEFFSRGVRRSGRKADASRPSGVEVKNISLSSWRIERIMYCTSLDIYGGLLHVLNL